MVTVSVEVSATPARATRDETPAIWTACFSNTCQFVTSTRPCVSEGMRCAGTRSRVRYTLASPRAGSSSRSRSRMVTFGHTTSTASEKRASPRAFTLLRMLHDASIAMTVVLPAPVAILQA